VHHLLFELVRALGQGHGRLAHGGSSRLSICGENYTDFRLGDTGPPNGRPAVSGPLEKSQRTEIAVHFSAALGQGRRMG
jgi:hypothetical protein